MLNIVEERSYSLESIKQNLEKKVQKFKDDNKGKEPILRGNMTNASRNILKKYHYQNAIDQAEWVFKDTYKMLLSLPLNFGEKYRIPGIKKTGNDKINGLLKDMLADILRVNDLNDEVIKVKEKETKGVKKINKNHMAATFIKILFSKEDLSMSSLKHAFLYVTTKGELRLTLLTGVNGGKVGGIKGSIISHSYKLTKGRRGIKPSDILSFDIDIEEVIHKVRIEEYHTKDKLYEMNLNTAIRKLKSEEEEIKNENGEELEEKEIIEVIEKVEEEKEIVIKKETKKEVIEKVEEEKEENISENEINPEILTRKNLLKGRLEELKEEISDGKNIEVEFKRGLEDIHYDGGSIMLLMSNINVLADMISEVFGEDFEIAGQIIDELVKEYSDSWVDYLTTTDLEIG